MRIPPPPRAMVPALAAVTGVAAAHLVDYAILFPNAGARADHLATTGHGYWPAAVAVAVGAGIVALALTAGRAALRAVKGAAPVAAAASSPSRRRDLAWLLTCQGAAFALLEAGERGLAGLPPSAVLHSPEFWLGIVLQLPVAWLAIRVLALVERTAFRLAAPRRSRPVRRAPALRLVTAAVSPLQVEIASRARPRAPPLAA